MLYRLMFTKEKNLGYFSAQLNFQIPSAAQWYQSSLTLLPSELSSLTAPIRRIRFLNLSIVVS